MLILTLFQGVVASQIPAEISMSSMVVLPCCGADRCQASQEVNKHIPCITRS